MNIGFDAKRLFNNFTGLGNYSRSLVYGLKKYFPENNYSLFTPKISDKDEVQLFVNNKDYNVVLPDMKPSSLWRSYGCTKEITNLNLDIFHGLSHELPLGIRKTGAKPIVTIHDLIYLTYPNDFSFFDRKIYDFKFRYACNNADRIIAVSNSTKNDIVRFYDISPKKIDVVYQSCHANFKNKLSDVEVDDAIKRYKLPDEFMLYVGSIIERKNLLNIVKALNSLKNTIDVPLVVIGYGKAYLKKVKSYISEKQLQRQVIFTQNVSYKDLPAIYSKAMLFVYPSQYEGFGIPVIEALQRKTPVITSGISSLPEAAGPGAFYCNPNDEDSIAEGISKILNDSAYSRKLADEGYMYVQQFNEEHNALNLMKTYQKVFKML